MLITEYKKNILNKTESLKIFIYLELLARMIA